MSKQMMPFEICLGAYIYSRLIKARYQKINRVRALGVIRRLKDRGRFGDFINTSNRAVWYDPPLFVFHKDKWRVFAVTMYVPAPA